MEFFIELVRSRKILIPLAVAAAAILAAQAVLSHELDSQQNQVHLRLYPQTK